MIFVLPARSQVSSVSARASSTAYTYATTASSQPRNRSLCDRARIHLEPNRSIASRGCQCRDSKLFSRSTRFGAVVPTHRCNMHTSTDETNSPLYIQHTPVVSEPGSTAKCRVEAGDDAFGWWLRSRSHPGDAFASPSSSASLITKRGTDGKRARAACHSLFLKGAVQLYLVYFYLAYFYLPIIMALPHPEIGIRQKFEISEIAGRI